MKIVVDGFGGDNAPLAVLQGCALAVEEYGVEILVTGDEGSLHLPFGDRDRPCAGRDHHGG